MNSTVLGVLCVLNSVMCLVSNDYHTSLISKKQPRSINKIVQTTENTLISILIRDISPISYDTTMMMEAATMPNVTSPSMSTTTPNVPSTSMTTVSSTIASTSTSTSSTVTTTTTSTRPVITSEPTTLPSTTQLPNPHKLQVGTWSVNDKMKNYTCIIVRMAMNINVTYPVNGSTVWKAFDFPANYTSSKGQCLKSSQFIEFLWTQDKYTSVKIIFDFVKNAASNTFQLTTVGLFLRGTSKLLPGLINVPTIYAFNNSGFFDTPLQRSYKCDRMEKWNMTCDNNETEITVVLSVKYLRLEAFHSTFGEIFSEAEDCETNNELSVFEIVVYKYVLPILFILMLLASFIYRDKLRRAHRYPTTDV